MSRARDPFLDGLRAVSVVRVILLHLLQHVDHAFVATFSYFMPGMPLMFFVSGALAAASLHADDAQARRRFWNERARRLLVPFWAFAAVILAVCAIGALASDDPAYAFPFDSLWRWALPLAGPQASPAFDELDWHLWFLSSVILMLASAPWTLRLHRRLPGAGALVFLAIGAALECANASVPGVVLNTLLFGGAFQLGYFYADGSLARAPRALLVGLAGVAIVFALLFQAARAPNEMVHAEPLALVALGLGFVALWMRARPFATRLFASDLCRSSIRAINQRAYTIYLWGPIGNDLANRIVRPANGAQYALEFALSLAFLAAAVRLFGRVEDWAARRKPSTLRKLAPSEDERARAAA